jgi:transcriptional regulator with XRE-family HTH domain
MRTTLIRMTLQQLLQQHGITAIRELMHRTGLSRQQSWNLWHGYAGVGKETMRRLHTSLGIPLEALLHVDPVPARKPLAPAPPPPRRRGRRRQRPSGEA